MEKQQLTRSCLSCGETKPISAFLQISGARGTNYGNICSTCRSTISIKAAPKEDSEEGGSTSTGLRIGNKERLQKEIDRKRQFQEKIEKEELEKDKLEKTKEDKKLFFDEKIKQEKDHREKMLDKKKSFLHPRKQSIKLGILQKKIETPELSKEEQQFLEEVQRLQGIAEEQKLTTVDLSVPYSAPQMSQIKEYAPLMNAFRMWLGKSAPMVIAWHRLFNEITRELSKAPVNEKDKNVLENYVRETWGPSRRR